LQCKAQHRSEIPEHPATGSARLRREVRSQGTRLLGVQGAVQELDPRASGHLECKAQYRSEIPEHPATWSARRSTGVRSQSTRPLGVQVKARRWGLEGFTRNAKFRLETGPSGYTGQFACAGLATDITYRHCHRTTSSPDYGDSVLAFWSLNVGLGVSYPGVLCHSVFVAELRNSA
jgi:hypothetical protein